jgi:hypothetical protein
MVGEVAAKALASRLYWRPTAWYATAHEALTGCPLATNVTVRDAAKVVKGVSSAKLRPGKSTVFRESLAPVVTSFFEITST